MAMSDRNDRQAFLDFFEGERKRLAKKTAQYNRKLKKEENPLLRIFFEDLADLNEGGKMLRGMLVGLGYRIAGGPEEGGSDALALAFEIFQTSVLIHDDIIDHATTRRGKITAQERTMARFAARRTRPVAAMDGLRHIADSAALCTGDLGLYSANLMLAESYAGDPGLGELIAYFDRVIIDTIRGELLDVMLPYELQDPSYTEEECNELLTKSIHDIYHLKTALYSLIGPLHLGMLHAGASKQEMAAMDRFADELGIAYQIMDDILGIFADADVLGKDIGSDVSEFKQTILYMYVRTMKPEYLDELLRYYGKPELSADDLEQVRAIFTESGALEYSKAAMNACFERAERKLRRMTFVKPEDRAILRGFIDWCRGRRY